MRSRTKGMVMRSWIEFVEWRQRSMRLIERTLLRALNGRLSSGLRQWVWMVSQSKRSSAALELAAQAAKQSVLETETPLPTAGLDLALLPASSRLDANGFGRLLERGRLAQMRMEERDVSGAHG
mgnify:CR=1 FL=1